MGVIHVERPFMLVIPNMVGSLVLQMPSSYVVVFLCFIFKVMSIILWLIFFKWWARRTVHCLMMPGKLWFFVNSRKKNSSRNFFMNHYPLRFEDVLLCNDLFIWYVLFICKHLSKGKLTLFGSLIHLKMKFIETVSLQWMTVNMLS